MMLHGSDAPIRESDTNVRSTHNGPGRVIQVLQGHASTIYRALVPMSALEALNCFELCDSDIPVTPSYLVLERDVQLHGSAEMYAVVSFSLPEECRSFTLKLDGTTLVALTEKERELLIERRDHAMVNPGIDGRYHLWLSDHERRLEAARASDVSQLPSQPLMSIVVPLFRTPLPYYRALMESILSQTYPHWELILVNASPADRQLVQAIASYEDGRIRVLELEENLGIAGNTNAGIRIARGSYISFVDHDDLLNPRALEMYVRAINEHPNADLLYCDEDNFHEDLADAYSPLLKPDFNLDLLYSHNYVVHMLTVSREALSCVELAPDETNGAQDYDLTLKISEVSRSIVHIPYILYHWRAHPGSTNGGVMESKPYAIAASTYALEHHFQRVGIDAASEPTDIVCVFRTVYPAAKDAVSVVIAPRTAEDLMETIDSLQAACEGRNLEFVAALPSEEAAQLTTEQASRIDTLVSVENDSDPLHRINAGVRGATHELLLICSDVIMFESAHFLDQLIGCLKRPEVGITAPKLLYGDALVAHAGAYVDGEGSIGLLNQNFTAAMGGGYHGFSECSCSYSAVGPTCFMIMKDDYMRHGGLDQRLGNTLLAMANLCFSLRAQKKETVVLPEALATARVPVIWSERDAAEAFQFAGCTEKSYKMLWGRWGKVWQRDTLFNPGLTMKRGYPQLDVADLPAPSPRPLYRRALSALKQRVLKLVR